MRGLVEEEKEKVCERDEHTVRAIGKNSRGSE